MTGTVSEALREAATRLSATSDTARLDAELLMAHALGVSRSDLLLRHAREAVPPQFAVLIDRRAAREPVAHILGEQEFYGRTFRVTAATLIPRGDSEVLVEAALALSPPPARVLDLGTGSGALLLSVLADCAAEGVGTDRSAAALEVARENANRLSAGSASSCATRPMSRAMPNSILTCAITNRLRRCSPERKGSTITAPSCPNWRAC